MKQISIDKIAEELDNPVSEWEREELEDAIEMIEGIQRGQDILDRIFLGLILGISIPTALIAAILLIFFR